MSDKSERLVNLTIALLEARRPMTFSDVKRRTGLYDQSDAESARRMFERDKDDLRRLGVPLIVSEISFGDDLGYRIARGDYELQDVDLTPMEVAALALAVHMIDVEGVRLAFTKLVARAPDPVPLDGGVPVRIALDIDPIDTVAAAVVGRQRLKFSYRPVHGMTLERHVDPYAVVQRRGSWYLIAFDHDRSAIRAFRLDRMVDRPQVEGPVGAFEAPLNLDVAEAVSGPSGDLVDAEVHADRATRWALEARGAVATGRTVDEREVFNLPDLDAQRDRPWLLGLSPGARVVAPADLADSVVEGLRSVLQAHSNPVSK